MTTVKIPITLIARTDAALLVDDGQREVWVPLSQIEDEIEEPTGHLGLVTTTAIIVPEWVAREKGFQPSNQDTATLDLFGGNA